MRTAPLAALLAALCAAQASAAPSDPPAAAATAAPSLDLAPAAARPGDAVLVRVRGATAAPSGTLAGRPLTFWKAPDGWRAVAALPSELKPGPQPAALVADGQPLSATLEIVDPGFRTSIVKLDLAPKFVEPPASVKARLEADRVAFGQAYAQPFSPPLFEGDFDWPRRAPTSGRFGDTRILNGKQDSVHYGLDLTGPRGSPVLAANDGVVAIARDAYMSGNTVVLWHGGGIYTTYLHMDRLAVKTGDRVKKGQRLGDLGSTGRSTGPHLHWGAKVAGLYVDPESLLAIDFPTGAAPPRVAASLPPEEPVRPETAAPPAEHHAAVPPADAGAVR